MNLPDQDVLDQMLYQVMEQTVPETLNRMQHDGNGRSLAPDQIE